MLQILEASGLAERDRQALLEMVMDVSGAKKAVEMGLDLLQHMNLFGIEGELFEVHCLYDIMFSYLSSTLCSCTEKNLALTKLFSSLSAKLIYDVCY